VPGHRTGPDTPALGGERPVNRAGSAGVLSLVASAALVAGCSSPSPSAHPKVGQTTTTAIGVAACLASQVSASVDFTKFGGTSSSVAGAVLFRDSGGTSCSLRGVPQVQVVSSGGQAIPTYQAPDFTPHPAAAVLSPADVTGSTEGASSFTISSWACPVGSFSLTVRFAGWTTSIPATSGAPSGACAASQEVDETLYVGPATTVGS
jgi:hypothetical protein